MPTKRESKYEGSKQYLDSDETSHVPGVIQYGVVQEHFHLSTKGEFYSDLPPGLCGYLEWIMI